MDHFFEDIHVFIWPESVSIMKSQRPSDDTFHATMNSIFLNRDLNNLSRFLNSPTDLVDSSTIFKNRLEMAEPSSKLSSTIDFSLSNDDSSESSSTFYRFPWIISCDLNLFDDPAVHIHHHTFSTQADPSPNVNIMGAVDTGCTTLLVPLSVAKLYNLDIRPLLDPFVIHFAEDETFANISHGVSRSLDYTYNFMAVSDKIPRVLIDIKQPARAGLTFIADAKSA